MQNHKKHQQCLGKMVGCAILLLSSSISFAKVQSCTAQVLNDVLAPATKQNTSVKINCHLTLPKHAKVDKQLIFEGDTASNTSLDCQGAKLQAKFASPSVLITSKQSKTGWSVPHDIQIKNCDISNALRIQGMARNGQGKLLKQSSQQAGHSKRAQAAAPHTITLDRLILRAGDSNMMYFAPGVHHVTLQNSQFIGQSRALGLYLDAESANNLIKNNVFNVQTKSREVLAIDGSAYNVIQDNRFINAKNGAIFLYRNCGEGGTIRHQAPTFNRILNNVFVLDQVSKQPQIWLASRNGNRRYCNADRGFAFGSSENNRDLATHNEVRDNQIKFSTMQSFAPKAKALMRNFIRVDEQPNMLKNNTMGQ